MDTTPWECLKCYFQPQNKELLHVATTIRDAKMEIPVLSLTKEMVMTLRGKSSSCRTGVVFWLCLILASQMLGTFGVASIMAGQWATQPSSNSGPPRADDKREMEDLKQKRNAEETAEAVAHDQSSSSARRKRALAKANFEQMKHDTDQLADLARALQEELGRSNTNVLSLDVIDKAGKIEKLAKKIRGSAKGI
jgi:hypothetical protein